MIVDLIKELGAWTWWIVGVILLGLELLVPGNVFVWFGVAAILTGALALFAGFAWQTELIIFAVLAVGLAFAGRRVFGRDRGPGDQPFLNDRAARLVGRDYVLAEPIVDGKGRVRIDDTNWRITGPDLPSGAKVRIAGADGAVLKVVSVEG